MAKWQGIIWTTYALLQAFPVFVWYVCLPWQGVMSFRLVGALHCDTQLLRGTLVITARQGSTVLVPSFLLLSDGMPSNTQQQVALRQPKAACSFREARLLSAFYLLLV